MCVCVLREGTLLDFRKTIRVITRTSPSLPQRLRDVYSRTRLSRRDARATRMLIRFQIRENPAEPFVRLVLAIFYENLPRQGLTLLNGKRLAIR